MRCFDMKIGEKIRAARKEKKWTQKELANKAGIAITSLQQYEYHKRQPTINQVEKIAKAFDIEIDYFMFGYAEKVANFHIEKVMAIMGYRVGKDKRYSIDWLEDKYGRYYKVELDIIENIKNSVLDYLDYTIRKYIDNSDVIPDEIIDEIIVRSDTEGDTDAKA